MSEQVNLGVFSRAEEARERERRRFDYEKVFWNTLYGVGLVGLGYVTVKLGHVLEDLTDPVGYLEDRDWLTLVSWVEGKYKDQAPAGHPSSTRIIFFRADPEAWEEEKAAHMLEEEEKPLDVRLLHILDRGFGRVGPALPVGVLCLNMFREWRRTKDG